MLGWGAGGRTHLAGQMGLLIAGQDLEDDTTTGAAQELLQCSGVAAHWLPIHLLDDVAHVQQALLSHHAPVQNAGNHQLTTLHTECHALGDGRQVG